MVVKNISKKSGPIRPTQRSTGSLVHLPISDHHDIMLYRENGTSCVGPATCIYEKNKIWIVATVSSDGHPAIRPTYPTAVGSFKFEFFKILFAESICLKLSFRLHVVAWPSDNGKYVRLKNTSFEPSKSSGGSHDNNTIKTKFACCYLFAVSTCYHVYSVPLVASYPTRT